MMAVIISFQLGLMGLMNMSFASTEEIADSMFYALNEAFRDTTEEHEFFENFVKNYEIVGIYFNDEGEICQVPENSRRDVSLDFMRLSTADVSAQFESLSSDISVCNQDQMAQISMGSQSAYLGPLGGTKMAWWWWAVPSARVVIGEMVAYASMGTSCIWAGIEGYNIAGGESADEMKKEAAKKSGAILGVTGTATGAGIITAEAKAMLSWGGARAMAEVTSGALAGFLTSGIAIVTCGGTTYLVRKAF